jgi:hypothetical protein
VAENPSPLVVAAAPPPPLVEDVVETMIVTAVILQPPAMPVPARIFSAADVDPSAPRVPIILPSALPRLEPPALPELPIAGSDTTAPRKKSFLGRLADFLVHGK